MTWVGFIWLSVWTSDGILNTVIKFRVHKIQKKNVLTASRTISSLRMIVLHGVWLTALEKFKKSSLFQKRFPQIKVLSKAIKINIALPVVLFSCKTLPLLLCNETRNVRRNELSIQSSVFQMQDETSEHSDIKVNYQSSESKKTMEHKAPCQQIKSPASLEISGILRSPDVFRRIQNNLSLVTTMSQISPVNFSPFHLFNICVNIILPSSPWLAKLTLPFRFSNHNHVWNSF